jgi:NADPH-dependent curcumin reductase CurA
MATYNTVVLAQRPKGDIKAGETFKLKPEKRIEESDLKDGQVLVESRYLSLDPAMRGWLNGMTTNSSPITSKYKCIPSHGDVTTWIPMCREGSLDWDDEDGGERWEPQLT